MAPPYGVEAFYLFFKRKASLGSGSSPARPMPVLRCLHPEPHLILALPASLCRTAAGSAQGTRRHCVYLFLAAKGKIIARGNLGTPFTFIHLQDFRLVLSRPMPRQARIEEPGAVHHIIARGIERGKIFRDDNDCDSFVARLGRLVEETWVRDVAQRCSQKRRTDRPR